MKTWIIAIVLLLATGAGGYYLYVRNQGPAESPVLAEARRGFADCPSPSAPGPASDGSAASKEQMLAAMRDASDFDKATATYTACLKAVQQRLHDTYEFSAAAAMRQVNELVTQLHNAAIDRDQKVADQVNAEIRKFKARGS